MPLHCVRAETAATAVRTFSSVVHAFVAYNAASVFSRTTVPYAVLRVLLRCINAKWPAVKQMPAVLGVIVRSTENSIPLI
jgi:hypothetical protein